MTKRTIRVGSRESKLAVAQARLVMEAVAAAHPDIRLELVTMKTTGDRILDRTLDQIGGKGLFVKELDRALAAGEIDLSVHSLKDLPMELAEGLPLAAYSRRADPRDALVLREGLEALAPAGVVGSSSRRRVVQLEALFPQAVFRSVRGNLQTRLEKLETQGYDALVLAAAGLERQGLSRRAARFFAPWEVIPAAGQGILAVQGREGEDHSFLDCVEDPVSRACALAERAFVAALDGGCSSPIAAYACLEAGELLLRGLYYDEEEQQARRGTIRGAPADGERLGQELADQLKNKTGVGL